MISARATATNSERTVTQHGRDRYTHGISWTAHKALTIIVRVHHYSHFKGRHDERVVRYQRWIDAADGSRLVQTTDENEDLERGRRTGPVTTTWGLLGGATRAGGCGSSTVSFSCLRFSAASRSTRSNYAIMRCTRKYLAQWSGSLRNLIAQTYRSCSQLANN